MQIVMKNQALAQTLESIISAYYALLPRQAAAFEKYVREESGQLVKPTGMSKSGSMMNWVKIPSVLYSFIKKEMRKLHGIDDFFRDYEHYKLLMQVWKAAVVKRKPTKVFRTN